MIPVGRIMRKEVITAHPNTPIYEALDILYKNKISGMPVVSDRGNVMGMLSEKDVLQLLVNSKVRVDATVADYMTRDVVCFTEQDSAMSVCEFFIKNNIRKVPICNNGKLAGIVSRRDILSLILEARNELSPYRFS